jgi:hypothetical protein
MGYWLEPNRGCYLIKWTDMKMKFIITVLMLFKGLFAIGQISSIETPWGTTVYVYE